jgi:ubiquitin carboxyl-terminal hydrolase 7
MRVIIQTCTPFHKTVDAEFVIMNLPKPPKSRRIVHTILLPEECHERYAYVIPFHFTLSEFTEANGWAYDDYVHVLGALSETKKTEGDRGVKFDLRRSALTYTEPSKVVNSPVYPALTGRQSTGYVGLRNQGGTCYMNSMLQSFFCTPAFRRFVFEIPTTGLEDVSTSIPLSLQRLFACMQLSDQPCSTAALTRSFGWDRDQTFVQHDVLEFCRVLMDNLETKMKGTALSGVIASQFRGKWRKYIRGVNKEFQTQTEQYFHDLPLQVRGCATLQKSFEQFVAPDLLTGDNQYRSEEYGMQDAKIGTEFLEFPSVLHLQLSRWEYDNYGRSRKINEKFVFPPTIDLAQFLAPDADRSRAAVYDLYGVLVHSGGAGGGHYYAFLRPTQEGQWLEFNDATVSPATPEQAIDDNFGGSTLTYSGPYSYNQTASAYMLVVRKHVREHRNDRTPER